MTFLSSVVLAANLLTPPQDNCPDPNSELPQAFAQLLAEECSPTTVFLTARYLLENGTAEQVLPWLSTLDQMQWALGMVHSESVESEQVTLLLDRINARARQLISAKSAFTLDAVGFFPEGITVDTSTNRVFLGSLVRNEIAILREGKNPTFWTLPKHPELRSIFGIKYDAGTDTLWVLRNRADPANSKSGQLLVLDGHNGGVLREVSFAAFTAVEPNDLCLSADHAYITDSRGHRVFRVSRDGGQAIELIPQSGRLYYPNGIACSPDGASVFVAHVLGLEHFDLASRRMTRIRTGAGESLGGIDGLAWQNNVLVGVQNAIGLERVIAIELNHDNAAEIRVLDRGNAHYAIPTTVAPYDGGVLVIANSQVDLIERFKEDPKSTMAQLQPTVVLKIDATAIH